MNWMSPLARLRCVILTRTSRPLRVLSYRKGSAVPPFSLIAYALICMITRVPWPVVYGGSATWVGTGCRDCRRFRALLDRRSKLKPVLFLEVIMRFTFSKLAGGLSPLPILLVCASGIATAQDPNVITASELAGSRGENTYHA